MKTTLRTTTATTIISTVNSLLTQSDNKQVTVCELMQQAGKRGTTVLDMVQTAYTTINSGLTGKYASWKGTAHHQLYRAVNCIASCQSTINRKFKSALAERAELIDTIEAGIEHINTIKGNEQDRLALLGNLEVVSQNIDTFNVEGSIARFDIQSINAIRHELNFLTLKVNNIIPKVAADEGTTDETKAQIDHEGDDDRPETEAQHIDRIIKELGNFLADSDKKQKLDIVNRVLAVLDMAPVKSALLKAA